MLETFMYPNVTIKNKVVSSDYHCADALLVEVEAGTGALAVTAMANGYEVELNGEKLFSVNEDGYCPTCGGTIYRGYGARNVSMEEAMTFSAQINAPYAGLHTAVERIQPLLGLLKSGCYMVADYELFPFTEDTFFWNYTGLPELFAAWGGRMGLEGYMIHKCPAYMIPSQRASACNPERIEHYIPLVGASDCPRAIGLYASGNAVLLLDGHHKAAAAAAKGRMVKCLVIMPVQLSEQGCADIGSGTLLHHEHCLLNDQAAVVGWVSPCLSRYAAYEEKREVPSGSDLDSWGKISEKYVPDRRAYRHIPHQEMMEWIYSGKKDSYSIARDVFRGEFRIPGNKQEALYWLRRHQAQFDALSGGALTPWQMPLLDRDQWNELNRAARKYGIDRDPKTANAVYGVFSFLPGQREIRDIPSLLEHKLKNEAIKTVLIPNSVREVDEKVFSNFPDLENIVLETGNPKLRPEHFQAITARIRAKRKDERSDALHLKQYPFADLAEMLKKKQEQQE